MAAKKLKGSGKEPAAGKLKTAARKMTKIFTPTADTPVDPNAKHTKKNKSSLTNMHSLLTEAMKAGQPGYADRIGAGHASLEQIRRWGNPWS